MERLIEKSVLAFVTRLVNKMGTNLCSKQHMKAMGDLMLRIERLLSAPEAAGSVVVDKLRKQFVLYTKICLDSVSFPIARKEALESTNTGENGNRDGDVSRSKNALRKNGTAEAHADDTNQFACVLGSFLTKRPCFCESGTGICTYQVPFPLLGFNVVEGHPLIMMESLVDSFHQIREAALKPTKWLERPKNIVLATPIQAAAAAYGLKQ
jgi:hypothetical protein